MMESTSTRTSVAVLLVLGCLGLHARAAAQPAIADASADEQASARAAYGEGVRAFERGEYAQALERFDAADDAVSSPNVKLMRARCLAQLGRSAEAHAMYSATVDEARASGERRYDASAAAAAEEGLALEAKIALLTVTAGDETGRAVLAINGEELPRERWSEAVPLAPGAVVVTLAGPEGQQDRAERTLAAGTRVTIELSVAAHVPQPVEAPVTMAAPPAATTRPADGGGLPVLPITLGAAGGVGLVAFAVFGAMSNSELDELERDCPSQKDCAPELSDVASRGRTYQTVANVSLGAGLVLLAAGATLLVLDLPSDDLEVAVTPHGAQLRGAL